jgi:hypothetical protein
VKETPSFPPTIMAPHRTNQEAEICGTCQRPDCWCPKGYALVHLWSSGIDEKCDLYSQCTLCERQHVYDTIVIEHEGIRHCVERRRPRSESRKGTKPGLFPCPVCQVGVASERRLRVGILSYPSHKILTRGQKHLDGRCLPLSLRTSVQSK